MNLRYYSFLLGIIFSIFIFPDFQLTAYAKAAKNNINQQANVESSGDVSGNGENSGVVNQFSETETAHAKEIADIQKLQEAEYKEEIRQLKLNTGFSMGVICLSLIGLILYFRKKQRMLHANQLLLIAKKQQIKLEKQELESELKEAAAQLYAFTMSIWNKNKLIEAYTEELKKNTGLSQDHYQVMHARNMEQLMQATLLTDEQWDSFRQVFDKVYPGYIKRLQQQLPGISPAETRYLVLRRLNLSNKEMAAMLGVGLDSIRQYRSRLRKKFNFTEDEKLDQLVLSI